MMPIAHPLFILILHSTYSFLMQIRALVNRVDPCTFVVGIPEIKGELVGVCN